MKLFYLITRWFIFKDRCRFWLELKKFELLTLLGIKTEDELSQFRSKLVLEQMMSAIIGVMIFPIVRDTIEETERNG